LAKNNKKIRTELRKNRAQRPRSGDWTRRFDSTDEQAEDQIVRGERISGKGELTRRRTVIGAPADAEQSGFDVHLEVDETLCQHGRVL
jgi:ribosome biogenesis GTPase / thiamine phosphate phosphatase